MHQREIDRAAGSAIGGTIAGMIIVFALMARFPKQTMILGLIVGVCAGVASAYHAWHDTVRQDALKWPDYDLLLLDSEHGRKETALLRRYLREPRYFKELDTREFLIRFLPTIQSTQYSSQMRCEAIFYKPGEPKPYAVMQTQWSNTVCDTDMAQPVLGHWKNGAWRIASLGKPLTESQVYQLAELITESTPGDPIYSKKDMGYFPWLRHFHKARWDRDWMTFYEGKDWFSVAF